MSRTQFESLHEHLFDSLMVPVHKVLKDTKVSAEQVDEVVLVGGSSRLPKVRQLLQQVSVGVGMCPIQCHCCYLVFWEGEAKLFCEA